MTFYDDPNRECVGLAPIWGDDSRDNVPNATGASAGAPGTWSPSGADVPSSASQANAWGVTASPATAWATPDDYVQGSAAGAAGQMHWNGTTWVGGKVPTP